MHWHLRHRVTDLSCRAAFFDFSAHRRLDCDLHLHALRDKCSLASKDCCVGGGELDICAYDCGTKGCDGGELAGGEGDGGALETVHCRDNKGKYGATQDTFQAKLFYSLYNCTESRIINRHQTWSVPCNALGSRASLIASHLDVCMLLTCLVSMPFSLAL